MRYRACSNQSVPFAAFSLLRWQIDHNIAEYFTRRDTFYSAHLHC